MKTYSWWFGYAMPETYSTIMQANRAIIEASGHEYEVIFDHNFRGTDKEAAGLKDNAAFAMLASQSCGVVDLDLRILSIPDTLPGAVQAIYEWGTPRIGWMISDNPEWFMALMEEKKRRGIAEPYGYPNKLLRDKKPIEIPRECYEHLRIMTGKDDKY